MAWLCFASSAATPETAFPPCCLYQEKKQVGLACFLPFNACYFALL